MFVAKILRPKAMKTVIPPLHEMKLMGYNKQCYEANKSAVSVEFYSLQHVCLKTRVNVDCRVILREQT